MSDDTQVKYSVASVWVTERSLAAALHAYGICAGHRNATDHTGDVADAAAIMDGFWGERPEPIDGQLLSSVDPGIDEAQAVEMFLADPATRRRLTEAIGDGLRRSTLNTDELLAALRPGSPL